MLALLLACRPEVVGDLGPMQVHVDSEFPTVLHVEWAWAGEGEHLVEYGLDDHFDLSTPVATSPELDVLGLKGGRSYTLRPVVVLPDGERVVGAPVDVLVDPPPADLTSWDISIDEVARQDEGRFLLVTFMRDGGGFIAILDREGDWVWWSRVVDGLSAVTSKPARDGRSLLVVNQDVGKLEDLGQVIRMPIRGGEVEVTRTTLVHHDFVELSNNRLSWIGLDVRDYEVGGTVVPMRGDQLLEGSFGATSSDVAEEVFNVFDDLGRDPWFPCDHAASAEVSPLGEAHDFTHGNSLGVTRDESALLFHARYLDALFKIDRTTGQILWQLGGEGSDFTVVGDVPLWGHGHVSDLRDGGMVMFDNASHDMPPVSGIVDYSWDEAARTVREVYRYDSPEGWSVGALGDVRRLANGNYMVTWGTEGIVQEVDPDAGVVWEAVAPSGTLVSRFTLFSDLYALTPRGGQAWDTGPQ